METIQYKPLNDGRDIRLRRCRDALAISGGAVIFFSLWDILKIFIGFFLGQNTISQFVSESIQNADISSYGAETEELARILLWVVTLAILGFISLIVLLYHLYIGLNAFRVGRQTAKKKKRLYLVLAAFSMIGSGLLLLLSALSVFLVDDSSNIDVATLLLELTSFLTYLSLITSAYKIRSLERGAL